MERRREPYEETWDHFLGEPTDEPRYDFGSEYERQVFAVQSEMLCQHFRTDDPDSKIMDFLDTHTEFGRTWYPLSEANEIMRAYQASDPVRPEPDTDDDEDEEGGAN